MDKNRRLLTKTIFMPPSLFLPLTTEFSSTTPPNPHLQTINHLKPITMWLYPQAGGMKPILYSDRLREWARLAHRSRLGFPELVPQEKVLSLAI